MQNFSLFDAEIKKLLATQERDRFPVQPCRAEPCRAGSRSLIEYHIPSNETTFISFIRNIFFYGHANLLNVHGWLCTVQIGVHVVNGIFSERFICNTSLLWGAAS